MLRREFINGTLATLAAAESTSIWARSPRGWPTGAARPTFSPGAGTYIGTQLVAISDATPGATIYYTLDGTTPTTSSLIYSGPISISSNTLLQAIATAPGFTQSAVAGASYVITSSGGLQITTTSLGNKATVGGSFFQQLQAINGVGPLSWGIIGPNYFGGFNYSTIVPVSNVTLTTNAVFTLTSSAPSNPFIGQTQVMVYPVVGSWPKTLYKSGAIISLGGSSGAWTVSTNIDLSNPSYVGNALNCALAAGPTGVNPYQLTLTGAVEVVPTTAETASLPVIVTDATGATATANLPITVGTQLQILGVSYENATQALPSAMVANAYSHQMRAAGGSGAGQTWSVTGLPTGLSMSTAGLITGIPTVAGAVGGIVVTLTDSVGPPISYTFSIAVQVNANVARPSYNTGTSFFTFQGKLYDPDGIPFTIRGMNQNHYDDTGMTGVAAAMGCNTVRIFSYLLNVQGDYSVSHYVPIVTATLEENMLPIFTIAAVPGAGIGSVSITGTAGQFSCPATSLPILVGSSINISGTLTGTGSITGYTGNNNYLVSATNGSTTFTLTTPTGGAIVTGVGSGTGLLFATAGGNGSGSTSGANLLPDLQACANWVAGNYAAFSANTAFNIANEWGDGSISGATWAAGYNAAVATIRAAGCKNLLCIDASGDGQGYKILTSMAAGVLANDPQQNIVFSFHAYGGTQNIQAPITSITRGTSTVIGINYVGPFNPFASYDIGNNFSGGTGGAVANGVTGMTQINGVFGSSATWAGTSGAYTVTLPINSTGFSAYTGGGTLYSAIHVSEVIMPALAALASSGVCCVVGEMGPGKYIGTNNASPTACTNAQVVAAAEANGLGWLYWAGDDNNLASASSSENWFGSLRVLNGSTALSNYTYVGIDAAFNPNTGVYGLATPASYFVGGTTRVLNYKWNPGDYILAANFYNVSVANAVTDLAGTIIPAGVAGFKGYSIGAPWAKYETGTVSTATTYDFSSFWAIFNYLQAVWPGAHLWPCIEGNHYTGTALTQAEITSANLSNPAGFYIPAYILNCGGSLTVPNSYGSSSTTTYAVAPIYAGASSYGLCFQNFNSGNQTFNEVVPQWYNAGVTQAYINMLQAWSQSTCPAPTVWASGTTYSAGQQVTSGGNTYTYINASNTAGNVVTNTSFWTQTNQTYVGLTMDQNNLIETIQNLDETTYAFISSQNFSTGVVLNPPQSVTGAVPSNTNFWIQRNRMYAAWASFNPHTVCLTCDTYGYTVGGSFGSDTPTNVAANFNSNITAANRSAPYALNTIVGLGLSGPDSYGFDFNATNNFANDSKQGFYGIGVPGAQNAALPTPTFTNLKNVMPYFKQIQPADYGNGFSGSSYTATGIQQIMAAAPWASHRAWCLTDFQSGGTGTRWGGNNGYGTTGMSGVILANQATYPVNTVLPTSLGGPLTGFLPAGHWVAAKQAMIQVYPRPDAETNTWARHHWGYYDAVNSVPYSIPLGVSFGAFPYVFQLQNGPPGMSIGATTWNTSWTSFQQAMAAGYGYLNWTPTGPVTNATVSILVTDQQLNTLTITFTVSTSSATSRFIFLDTASGSDSTGTGAISAPWKTLTKAFGSTYAASVNPTAICYLRGTGTYAPPIMADNDVGRPVLELHTANKPSALIGFPGDAQPIIDQTNGGFATNLGGADLFMQNLNANSYNATQTSVRMVWVTATGPYSERMTFDNNLWSNSGYGSSAGNNATGYFIDAAGSPAATYIFLNNCTETNRQSGNAGNNYAGCSFYNVNNALVQGNLFNAPTCTVDEAWQPKSDVSNGCWRGNTTIVNSVSYTYSPLQQVYNGFANFEICYNTLVSASGGLIAVPVPSAPGVFTNLWCYRNSVSAGGGLQAGTPSTNGPYVFQSNAVQTTQALPSGSAVTTSANVYATSGLLTSSGQLTPAYSADLGTVGAQIA